jgi:hypothetical protein
MMRSPQELRGPNGEICCGRGMTLRWLTATTTRTYRAHLTAQWLSSHTSPVASQVHALSRCVSWHQDCRRCKRSSSDLMIIVSSLAFSLWSSAADYGEMAVNVFAEEVRLPRLRLLRDG